MSRGPLGLSLLLQWLKHGPGSKKTPSAARATTETRSWAGRVATDPFSKPSLS